jgi:hypothetical protein
VLLDDVRSSIDYYRNQSGSVQLRRVYVTGGSAQLPGLPERLSALLGVPVEPAYMQDVLRIGDIGFSPEEFPRLEPYLPAPVGLALGGTKVGTVIDLRPSRRAQTSKRTGRVDPRAIAAAAVAVVELAGGTYLAHNDQANAKSKSTAAEATVTKLKSELLAQQTQANASPGGGAASAATLKADVANVLGQDVAWKPLIDSVTGVLPPGVVITSFSGTHTVASATAAGAVTPAATTAGTAAAGATAGSADVCSAIEAPSGTVSINATAPDLISVAQLLDLLNGKVTNVAGPWASTAHVGSDGTSVEFTLTTSLGATARGHRLEDFFKGTTCK